MTFFEEKRVDNEEIVMGELLAVTVAREIYGR